MAKRSTKVKLSKRAIKEARGPVWRKVLLTLSLVPMVIGILLIGSWALDFNLFTTPEEQITVGSLFLLFSFAASNALQEKWRLAGGWTLILLADWLLLTRLNLWVQGGAILAGGVGAILVGFEYFQRIAAQKA